MFLLVVGGCCGFSCVVFKWGNVLFFAFHAVCFILEFFGVVGGNVISSLRGLGLVGFFVFIFIWFCFWFFV
jgi:hypothetical protein